MICDMFSFTIAYVFLVSYQLSSSFGHIQSVSMSEETSRTLIIHLDAPQFAKEHLSVKGKTLADFFKRDFVF